MADKIHPTAIIEPGAQLGAGVEIGAYAFVGGDVTLGEGTRLHHHAAVEGHTILGRSCEEILGKTPFDFMQVGWRRSFLSYPTSRLSARVAKNSCSQQAIPPMAKLC